MEKNRLSERDNGRGKVMVLWVDNSSVLLERAAHQLQRDLDCTNNYLRYTYTCKEYLHQNNPFSNVFHQCVKFSEGKNNLNLHPEIHYKILSFSVSKLGSGRADISFNNIVATTFSFDCCHFVLSCLKVCFSGGLAVFGIVAITLYKMCRKMPEEEVGIGKQYFQKPKSQHF